jgi:hypothetical protein
MKINTKNIEKVNSEIAAAEGRATARTVCADDVETAIEKIEKRLCLLLLKKDWKGLKFAVDSNAQNFASSYKYKAYSTQVVLERGATGWFITKIDRAPCVTPANEIVPVNISSKKEELVSFVSQSKNWE